MGARTLQEVSFIADHQISPSQDVLTDLPLSERHQKLQETYENLLEAEYGELAGVDVEPFLDGPDSSNSDGMGNGVKRFKGDDDE